MTGQAFNQIQVIELRRLLGEAANDPILAPQLRRRLEAAERAAQEQSSGTESRRVQLPRTAIFLRGGGVQDSDGIRPSLAGEALIQYERMFTEQALYDEREAAKDAGKSRRP